MPPADEVIKWNLKIRNYENNWRYSTRSTSSPGLTVKTDICLLKSWIKEQQVAWRAKENQEKNLHTIYITTQHPQKLYYSFRLKLEEIFCLTIVLCSNRLFLSQHCPCQLLAGVFTGMAISLTRHFKKKKSIFRRPSHHTNYKASEAVTWNSDKVKLCWSLDWFSLQKVLKQNFTSFWNNLLPDDCLCHQL